MVDHVATCQCGQLRAQCHGDPVRVSVCHCLDCQKRTGSALSVQARWQEEQVALSGEFREWTRTADSGNRSTSRFCPHCGSTVVYSGEGMPGFIAIPVGAFADPQFQPPSFSVYEERQHGWVAVLGDHVEHID
jgi:hypothetical protein